MVEYLRSVYGIRKIAVVDTDVHHGDGSQDIFYHDPDTLYISFHQDGRTLYPVRVFLMKPAVRQPGAQISTCRCCRAQVMRDCTDYMMV